MSINRLVGQPLGAAVTLAEAKQHLRVLHASEDALIARYATAARQHVEAITGRSVVLQVRADIRDAFPLRAQPLKLARGPVRALLAIEYMDPAGQTQTLREADVRIGPSPTDDVMMVSPSTAAWPSIQPGSAITITYAAGYEDLGQHEPLRAAILLLTAHWYDNRGATADKSTAPPFAIDALLAPYMTTGWI